MTRYTVTLRFNADIALDMNAADNREAQEAAREDLVRRFSLAGADGTAELRIGRYTYQINLRLNQPHEAEVIDVEEADFRTAEDGEVRERTLTAEERAYVERCLEWDHEASENPLAASALMKLRGERHR